MESLRLQQALMLQALLFDALRNVAINAKVPPTEADNFLHDGYILVRGAFAWNGTHGSSTVLAAWSAAPLCG